MACGPMERTQTHPSGQPVAAGALHLHLADLRVKCSCAPESVRMPEAEVGNRHHQHMFCATGQKC